MSNIAEIYAKNHNFKKGDIVRVSGTWQPWYKRLFIFLFKEYLTDLGILERFTTSTHTISNVSDDNCSFEYQIGEDNE